MLNLLALKKLSFGFLGLSNWRKILRAKAKQEKKENLDFVGIEIFSFDYILRHQASAVNYTKMSNKLLCR